MSWYKVVWSLYTYKVSISYVYLEVFALSKKVFGDVESSYTLYCTKWTVNQQRYKCTTEEDQEDDTHLEEQVQEVLRQGLVDGPHEVLLLSEVAVLV